MLEGFARDFGCGVLMAVSDHTTASRGGQVYELADGKLRLMHNDPDVIDINPQARSEQAG